MPSINSNFLRRFSQSWLASGPAVALASAGLAFCLYLFTAAPGLTWAYHGADAGDLLAAAATNGVPHPPGYPLYTLLLQAWIATWDVFAPMTELARRGNLLSALWGAVSVGITTDLVFRLSPPAPKQRILRAAVGALAWMGAPLFWGQALITEVYTLHVVIFTAMAWLVLVYHAPSPLVKAAALGLVTGMGMAHHITLVLLLPAGFYWLWTENEQTGRSLRFWLIYGLATLLPLLLYLRIYMVAGATPPPPVNWGYPDSLERLWWLISGSAYRRYLFAADWTLTGARISNWALILSTQYTLAGFGIAMTGLYALDQDRPRLRNFSLIWILPVSLYSVSYNTVDSEIYLLPVIWIMALWLPEGVTRIARWIAEKRGSTQTVAQWLLLGSVVGLLLLTAVRLPVYSLREDTEAMVYLQGLGAQLEPNSIVLSSGDAETFTLWYGTYATRELLVQAPDLVLLNVALFQFDWYQRLVMDLHPDLVGVESGSVSQILQENVGRRPIYFAEIVAPARADQLVPVGPLWRYEPMP